MSASNSFEGCRFSILGDSISTLKGYLPPYCKSFYMQNPRAVSSGISRPMDTWWAQVISHFSGTLCVNNSYSGCLVSGMDFPSATHLLRYRQLHCNPGMYHYAFQNDQLQKQMTMELMKPDLILVYLGTNDWIFRSPILPDADDRSSFAVAYPLLLHKLCTAYPDSRIICATLFQQEEAVLDALHPLSDYNSIIRQSAQSFGCSTAELCDPAETIETIDGIHPSYQGMQVLSKRWIRSMTNMR